jgi:hypothetical protein
LVDQKSFYVGISRARQSATVVTNDRAKLVAAIRERAGTVQTALVQAAVSNAAGMHAAGAAVPQVRASRSPLGAGL